MQGRLDQWPVLATSGALEVRLAETDAEVEAAQRLRYRVFYEEMDAEPSPEMRAVRRDFDRFDQYCDHLLLVDRAVVDDEGQPAVVGCYRMMRDVDAARAGGFYTATEFDIAPVLASIAKGTRFLELGRSCVIKEYRTKSACVQLLWRGLMAFGARFSIDTMFGCASFAGTDVASLALPLSYLYHNHLSPPEIRVRARPELFVNMNLIPKDAIDKREALRSLPPLLKGYIRTGCTIGDGAVIDHQFSTTDVFICVEISKMDARYKSRFGLSA